MLKKIFIVSTILLLVSLVFFGIYLLAFNENKIITKKENIKYLEENLNEDVINVITNITSEPVLSASISPDKEYIYYVDALYGDVSKMTIRGTNNEKIKKETMGVPQKARWSNDGSMVILSYGNGVNFVKNYQTGESFELRTGMDNVEWAGANNKILYKYYDENSNERSLNIANKDGSNWKKIAVLPFRYVDFTAIPSSIFAAFWPMSSFDVDTKLFVTSTINNSSVNEVFSNKKGADFLFSPDGQNILISSVYNNGKNITLGMMDSDGNNYNDFKIPTIIKKVVWSKDGKTVYYAQPTSIPENIVWPNDYREKKFFTQDTFYKIDIESGKKERIVGLEEIREKIDAVDLFLSPTEDALYFINRENSLLYKMKI